MSGALEPDRVYTADELAAVLEIRRPHRNLMKYYVLSVLPLLVFPPLCLVLLMLLYFRYHTMQYRFDGEGVMMRWGILYRREVTLAYARIQDIHLTSNFIERWLRLARIQVSTASGSAAAELTVEGLQEFELVRDFLYTRMRGATDRGDPRVAANPVKTDVTSLHDVCLALRQVSDDLRAVREALASRRSAS
jgi:putative membrane protein